MQWDDESGRFQDVFVEEVPFVGGNLISQHQVVLLDWQLIYGFAICAEVLEYVTVFRVVQHKPLQEDDVRARYRWLSRSCDKQASYWIQTMKIVRSQRRPRQRYSRWAC